VQKGIGNQVTIEFNLIYRWHSAISKKNEKWLDGFFGSLFPEKNLADINLPDFKAGMQMWAKQIPNDPSQRTFADLKRNAQGFFDDKELVRILTEATEDLAESFGARQIPLALKAVEIMGMEQGRAWGAATLNELRRYFGMMPHKTFTDINSDMDIAASLEALYEDVDNVEMYPGVIVEEPKLPFTPGAGLCAGFTTTRAILSDAIALVRGDRFFTLDFTPVALTAWGFKEIEKNISTPGGMIYKLLMRAFPAWYRQNSIYAYFPFVIPSEMRSVQQSLGHEAEYDYSRPSLMKPPKVVMSWQASHEVIMNSKTYKVPWGPAMKQIQRCEYMLGGDDPEHIAQRKFLGQAIFDPENSINDFRNFFEATTTNLVRKYSTRFRNSFEVDIVKNIANPAWTQFAACLFNIPHKEKQLDAVYNDREVYDRLSTIFQFIHLNYDTSHALALKDASLKANKELVDQITPVCVAAKSAGVAHFLQHLTPKQSKYLPNHGDKLLHRLFESGKSVEEVVGIIVMTAGGITIPSAQGITQVIDLFLTEPYDVHWPDIQTLSYDPSPEAFEKLRKYALEALRLTTPAAGILRIASTNTTLIDDPTTHAINKGDPVLLNISAVSVDPEKFPDPMEIRLDRQEDLYQFLGGGQHRCLGRHIAAVGIAAQLRVFGKLKNMRRAPGPQGKITKKGRGPATRFLTEGRDA
jgi:cytochrome P450